MGCLYKLTSPSKTIYYGITSQTPNQRWAKHKYDAFNFISKGPLQKAIRRYGWDNFTKEILFETDDWELLCLLEIEYISYAKLNGIRNYNLALGGQGPYGVKRSDEFKKKMSLARIGIPSNMTDEERRKRSDNFSGERNRFSKLSNEQILEIFNLTKTDKSSQQIADLFSITPTHVNRIKSGSSCFKITGVKRPTQKQHRLTEEEVVEIANMRKQTNLSPKELLPLLSHIKNINFAKIEKIVYLSKWKHVTKGILW